MRQQTLWRLAGVAAVLGGLIDLVGPLPPRKGPFRVASALWIAAFVIGLAGLALKDQGLAHRLAGWCFALGFVAVGVILARTASRAEA